MITHGTGRGPEGGHEPHRDVEGEGLAAGLPSEGRADTGANEPLGRPGLKHWRESTITDPSLDDRGNVFFAAVEMTRMPMVLTDPNIEDNPIVFANKAFMDLTGYEENEILGRNCRFLQGANSDRETVRQLREAICAHQSIAVELLNYRRDGSPFWNAVFIGPVYDKAGKLLYFFASQLDVTRRRDTEQNLKQAQKMEAIGQLTAGLAHDFNNLLQVIGGNLELLAGRLDHADARAQRLVANATTAADRGAKLTRQLLAFARKTRLDPRPTDLGALIRGFREVMESSVGRSLQLELDLPSGLPRVLVDSVQLESALLNIIINARDAMPRGGRVIVRTRAIRLDEPKARDLEPGDYLALEVIDEGEGMPPHVAERAMEPFFTTKGVGKGTGLGLAMASGYAQQSKGRIEIESELGTGTTVRLLFPVAADARPNDVSHPGQSEEGRAVPDTRKHILVVEDNDEILDLARDILEGAGYRITEARNGEEGLEAFDRCMAKGGLDLVFTDLVMPGSINGVVLADTVAQRDATVPVLMTTGYNEELVTQGGARNADVLSKPYRRAELLDRIAGAIRNGPRTGERRKASEFGAAQA